MSSEDQSVRTKDQDVISEALVPMEHDPLRDCHNTVLRLIQRRQLCLEGFIGERHDGHYRELYVLSSSYAHPMLLSCNAHRK
jgi:hypothetical protein